MENSRCLSSSQNAAFVIMSFLQADCTFSENHSEYCHEILSLEKELNVRWDAICNSPRINDGSLETDGHIPSKITVSLHDIQPLGLEWLRGHEEAAALQEVAEGLRIIADQFEHSVMARATQNLSRNISDSPSQPLKHFLVQEVDKVMRQGVGLEHLPQERVMVAVTLTLVKGVCKQTPRLLRSLFDAVLNLICQSGAS